MIFKVIKLGTEDIIPLKVVNKEHIQVKKTYNESFPGRCCDVSIGRVFQVKVLDVLGYEGSAKEFEHLKILLGGMECIEKVLVELIVQSYILKQK